MCRNIRLSIDCLTIWLLRRWSFGDQLMIVLQLVRGPKRIVCPGRIDLSPLSSPRASRTARKSPMSIQRRKALITGAGRNIGRAIALRLARSGCDVVIHTRAKKAQAEAVAEAARAFGVETLVCLGDIGSRDDIRQMTACVLAS